MERGCFGKECCSSSCVLKWIPPFWLCGDKRSYFRECVLLLTDGSGPEWFRLSDLALSLSVLSLTRFPASLRLSCHSSESRSECCVICDLLRGCWWNTSLPHTRSIISSLFPRFLLQLSSSSSWSWFHELSKWNWTVQQRTVVTVNVHISPAVCLWHRLTCKHLLFGDLRVLDYNLLLFSDCVCRVKLSGWRTMTTLSTAANQPTGAPLEDGTKSIILFKVVPCNHSFRF